MGATRDCKHGQLARSCEVCEAEAERDALAAEVERLRRWIRDICWDRLDYSKEEIECLMACLTRGRDHAE